MATAESLAPESAKVKKAREKLNQKWEEEKAQITPKALKSTIDKIHKWIADNAKYRVPIKEKSIRLFNQNKDAALMSKKVQAIAEKLKQNKDLC